MKILGIIPARYQSSRFPGKPLADIDGVSMIQRVYSQASKAKGFEKVIVATDNKEIRDHVKDFGGHVVMTDPAHSSGTDRCAEAFRKESAFFDFVINVQGDEPFISPIQIDTLADALRPETELATLIKKVNSVEVLENPNEAKVVINEKNEALYFSRNAIPFLRDYPRNQWLSHHTFYKHIGIYAYRSDILEEISLLDKTPLEKAESLEMLRWLEIGYTINVTETDVESLGIDTPEDVERVLSKLSRD